MSGSPQASASSRPSFSSRSASALLSAPAQTSASGQKIPVTSNNIYTTLNFAKLLTRADCSSRDMAYEGANYRQPTAQPEKEIHAFSCFHFFWNFSAMEIENRLCVPGACLQRKRQRDKSLMKLTQDLNFLLEIM